MMVVIPKQNILFVLYDMITNESIQDFFGCYASTLNNALFGDAFNSSVFEKSFAKYIVGANPKGVAGGANDTRFQEIIRQGVDFYRKIGITSMNILSTEVTALNDFHVMAKVSWNAFYSNSSHSGEIPFEVFYFLQSIGDGLKIFAYVTGDEQLAFEKHQLIPAS